MLYINIMVYVTAEVMLTGSENLGATLLSPVTKRKSSVVDNTTHQISPELHKALVTFVKKRYHEESKQMTVMIPTRYKQFKRLEMFGKVYGSTMWNNGESSHVLSRWLRSTRQNANVGTMYPGIVEFYLQVDFIFKNGNVNTTKSHNLASCKWYRVAKHDKRLIDSRWYGTFSSAHNDVIIPVYNIASDFIPAPTIPNQFQILTLPNQLSMWTPDEYTFEREG